VNDSVMSVLCHSRHSDCAPITSGLSHVEHLLTPPNGPEIIFSDMTMMIMTGGRERTREEFSELFSAAGFHLEQVVATKLPFTLLVGAPV
jgi:hypothetical protein